MILCLFNAIEKRPAEHRYQVKRKKYMKKLRLANNK